ncbi:uncharacterized protein BP5553_10290 [Venustampulla echinocandica]|uniref:Uncharacterized protein n=1 Tax=Venustampulla echinocandica TaxID=2656787 RepID=A0A370T9U9_9HELO|nr:uncharacterized protein BP5553_10290 [Venustampulla echinocandica]RDL30412.1 hypothetical protein BP5553_10290 [Venustampulla echinocandica]
MSTVHPMNKVLRARGSSTEAASAKDRVGPNQHSITINIDSPSIDLSNSTVSRMSSEPQPKRRRVAAPPSPVYYYTIYLLGSPGVTADRAQVEPYVTDDNEQLFRTYHPPLKYTLAVEITTGTDGKRVWCLEFLTKLPSHTHVEGLEIHTIPTAWPYNSMDVPRVGRNLIYHTFNPRRVLSQEDIRCLVDMFPNALGAQVLIAGRIRIPHMDILRARLGRRRTIGIAARWPQFFGTFSYPTPHSAFPLQAPAIQARHGLAGAGVVVAPSSNSSSTCNKSAFLAILLLLLLLLWFTERSLLEIQSYYYNSKDFKMVPTSTVSDGATTMSYSDRVATASLVLGILAVLVTLPCLLVAFGFFPKSGLARRILPSNADVVKAITDHERRSQRRSYGNSPTRPSHQRTSKPANGRTS